MKFPWNKSRRTQSLDLSEDAWSTRCGRCAEILPDETMTFCPACGVPYSRVPPTGDFESLSEHRHVVQKRFQQFFTAGVSVLIFAGMWGLALSLSAIESRMQARAMQKDRSLIVYTYNRPGFPVLDPVARRLGVAIALQAFADHFGKKIPSVEIREEALPPELHEKLSGPWRAENENLSFWEKQVIFDFARNSGSSLNDALPVIISNFPLYVDDKAADGMETRHLSRSGLISGLGSPAFVLVSTYRILADKKEIAATRPYFEDDFARARYLGEYLLAHELGHALLGLNDYVIDAAEQNLLRSPASTTGRGENCLMHTDAGGGLRAWASLKKRKLGLASECRAYDEVLQDFSKREKAIELLKHGQRSDAERLHTEVLAGLKKNASPWMVELLRKEHLAFLSPWKRWWGLFTFEKSSPD